MTALAWIRDPALLTRARADLAGLLARLSRGHPGTEVAPLVGLWLGRDPPPDLEERESVGLSLVWTLYVLEGAPGRLGVADRLLREGGAAGVFIPVFPADTPATEAGREIVALRQRFGGRVLEPWRLDP